MSGAINKDLFNKKGTLSFRASDIFTLGVEKSTTLTENFTNYTEFWETNLHFHLTYALKRIK